MEKKHDRYEKPVLEKLNVVGQGAGECPTGSGAAGGCSTGTGPSGACNVGVGGA